MKDDDALILRYTEASQALSTRRTYEQAVRSFKSNGGSIPATAQSVAAYLAKMAGLLAVSTLTHRLSAIHHAHVSNGLKSPVHEQLVKQTLQGIKRTVGEAPRRAQPLLKDDICELLVQIDMQKPLKAARDRALTLIGFAGAFRRSELVALTVRDLIHHDSGIELVIRRSKTDQTGQGRTIYIPRARSAARCPCRALTNWLSMAGVVEGAIFRQVSKHDLVVGAKPLSAQAVAMVIKSAVRALRGDEAAKLVSGHSLRSGFATEAASIGMQTSLIMAQTGHKSADMLFRVYIRPNQRREARSLL